MTAAFAAALSALLPAVAAAAQSVAPVQVVAPPVAMVQQSSGSVSLRAAAVAVPSSAAPTPLRFRARLHRGDRLTVGAGGSVTLLLLPSGARLRLLAGADIRLTAAATVTRLAGPTPVALPPLDPRLLKGVSASTAFGPRIAAEVGRGINDPAPQHLSPNAVSVRLRSPLTLSWKLPALPDRVDDPDAQVLIRVNREADRDSGEEAEETLRQSVPAAQNTLVVTTSLLHPGAVYRWNATRLDGDKVPGGTGRAVFRVLTAAAEADLSALEQAVTDAQTPSSAVKVASSPVGKDGKKGTKMPAAAPLLPPPEGEDTPLLCLAQTYDALGLPADALPVFRLLAARHPGEGSYREAVAELEKETTR